MKILCDFFPCRFDHIFNVLINGDTVDSFLKKKGLYQCRRCKKIIIGIPMYGIFPLK